MAAVEVSGSSKGQRPGGQVAGGGQHEGSKEKCTDDPNFAVLVAFIQVTRIALSDYFCVLAMQTLFH